eukprot:TRINITY_DN12026_c0_g1_i1.p1 TRINITY_DN12026_c0_g1~~TRINITY_DN12026_c0_g1_i1.p1  ORF type:complete len:562 (-),score=79.36 TRINITY_DN12026_c0_g1_i1:116-1768(-)
MENGIPSLAELVLRCICNTVQNDFSNVEAILNLPDELLVALARLLSPAMLLRFEQRVLPQASDAFTSALPDVWRRQTAQFVPKQFLPLDDDPKRVLFHRYVLECLQNCGDDGLVDPAVEARLHHPYPWNTNDAPRRTVADEIQEYGVFVDALRMSPKMLRVLGQMKLSEVAFPNIEALQTSHLIEGDVILEGQFKALLQRGPQQFFYLQCCRLSDDLLADLFDAYTSTDCLFKLTVWATVLASRSFDSLCALITRASRLTYLLLSDVNLAGGMASVLFRILGESAITFLKLEDADLSNSDLSLLFSCRTLKRLDLTSCELGANEIGSIARGIVGHRGIKSLNLSENEIEAEGAAVLASSLPACRLRELKLDDCRIRPDGAQQLLTALALSSTIKVVHMDSNMLTHECLSALAMLISNSSSLETLSVRMCALRDFAPLEQPLCQNSTLLRLHLDENRFGDEGACCLARVLRQGLVRCNDLTFSGNLVRGPAAIELAEAIASRRRVMSNLDLSSNFIGDARNRVREILGDLVLPHGLALEDNHDVAEGLQEV